MTAQELHIDLDIDLQKINTNFTRNIEPREKDWILNRETIRYLNTRTRDISNFKRKGFEEDTKLLKDVEPLIKSKLIDVEWLNNEKGRFILPSFVYKYVSLDTIFYYDCKDSEGEEKIKNLNIHSFTINNDFPNDAVINIKIGGIEYNIFNVTNIPEDYIGEELIYKIKAIYIALVNALDLSVVKDNNIEIYYEWCYDQYKENTFFIIGGTALQEVLISSIIDGVQESLVTKTNIAINIRQSSKDITKPARIVSHELINWAIRSDLSNSVPESPLSTFNKNFGYVYFPENIIIKQVQLYYICKPRLIDILLNQSLNLDADTCAEIVSRTARVIKALLDSDNYEKYLNETNLIE